MKRKNKILASVIIIATFLIIFLLTPYDKQVIPASFTAGENMGFNLDPGELNFGKIIPGNTAKRSITITNTHNKKTKTIIKSSGAISKHITISENDFILQPNQEKNITFSCHPEKGIKLKEYTGEITIITSKA